MPIRVILDTNVYSSDKFRLGQGFKTLGSLCKHGHVEVLLPYIVKREFETQLESNASEIVAGFEKFGKRLVGGPISSDLREELDNFIKKLKARRQEVIGSHSANFAAWLKECAVNQLTLEGQHAVAAMENYFSAGPPFQSPKTREDIPDAMIYQAVVSCAGDGPIVFVCNDKKLVGAISGIENITHYTDLNGFIASVDVQTIISKQEAAEAEHATNILQLMRQLASTSPNAFAEFVSENGGEGLAGTSFTSPSIPSDDREAYIYAFGSLDGIEFDWSRASYHGDLVYIVPFSGEGEFNITYYVSKWDVEDIEKRGGSYSDHNDYVVEADEETGLSVSGTLRIKISKDFKLGEELADAIEEMAIDSLEDPILLEDRD